MVVRIDVQGGELRLFSFLRLARAGGLKEGAYTVYGLVCIESFHRLPFQKIFIRYLRGLFETSIFSFQANFVLCFYFTRIWYQPTKIHRLLSDNFLFGITLS